MHKFVKTLEIKTFILLKTVFGEYLFILLPFFLDYWRILLIPAVTAQSFNPTPEIVMCLGIPTKEVSEKAKMFNII